MASAGLPPPRIQQRVAEGLRRGRPQARRAGRAPAAAPARRRRASRLQAGSGLAAAQWREADLELRRRQQRGRDREGARACRRPQPAQRRRRARSTSIQARSAASGAKRRGERPQHHGRGRLTHATTVGRPLGCLNGRKVTRGDIWVTWDGYCGPMPRIQTAKAVAHPAFEIVKAVGLTLPDVEAITRAGSPRLTRGGSFMAGTGQSSVGRARHAGRPLRRTGARLAAGGRARDLLPHRLLPAMAADSAYGCPRSRPEALRDLLAVSWRLTGPKMRRRAAYSGRASVPRRSR